MRLEKDKFSKKVSMRPREELIVDLLDLMFPLLLLNFIAYGFFLFLKSVKHGQRPYEAIDAVPEAFGTHGLGVDGLAGVGAGQRVLDHEFDVYLCVDLTQRRL